MMEASEAMRHPTWECNYHVVFVPKYRRRALYWDLREQLKDALHSLASQKQCSIIEDCFMLDHVYMLVSIPPKYAVSQIVDFLKSESASHLARSCAGKSRKLKHQHFWSRGYLVSTVERNEKTIRDYVKVQEIHQKQSEQLSLATMTYL